MRRTQLVASFLLATLSFAVISTGMARAQLLIDFNSTTQDGGPHNEAGYQPYNAGHEVAADFTTQTFTADLAFSGETEITITPFWPDTTDNRVEQMIDRGPGNDANWQGTKLDLLTDFLGIDARTANGGNGDYDGTTGLPTRMFLLIGGLPEGEYSWISYHHDTENVHTPFTAAVSSDGGGTFTPLGTFEMTNSSTGSNPPEPQVYQGIGGDDPLLLPSTVFAGFSATGQNDVVLEFTPLARLAVHEQIFGINGFELYQTSVPNVPEPSSFLLLLSCVLGAFGWLRRR